MAALNAARLATHKRSGPAVREPGVKAGTICWQGGMVALDAAGFAVPAAAVPVHKVLGSAMATADNSAGQNGDVRVRTEAGVFRFDNSSGADLIALTDIGSPAYVVDDHTVAKTSNSNARPQAGTIFDVDALGVWIRFS